MSSLIIFDLDNTLVHSQIDYAKMRQTVIAVLHDYSITRENTESLRRYSVAELINKTIAWDKEHGTDLEKQCWQNTLEIERAGMAKATVEADASQILKVLLDGGNTLTILTNNARAATEQALRQFDLYSYFSQIITRDDNLMKPAPDGILTAKSTFEAKSTFMIGDSWLDGKAAQNANVPFVAFRPIAETFKGRDIPVWRTINNLRELPELIAT